jgi:hypothetical protein
MERKGFTISEELFKDLANDWYAIPGLVQEKSNKRVYMWLYSFPQNMGISCRRNCLDVFHEDSLAMMMMIEGVG